VYFLNILIDGFYLPPRTSAEKQTNQGRENLIEERY
jgi:hypothetical protein